MYVGGLNAEDRYPAFLQSVRQRRVGPVTRTTPRSQPDDNRLLCDTTWDPKLRRSGGSPGIDGSQNAINMLVNQSSAFPSETERVGESAGG